MPNMTTLFEAAAANDVRRINELLNPLTINPYGYSVNTRFHEIEEAGQVAARVIWASGMFYVTRAFNSLPGVYTLQRLITQHTYNRENWTALHFAAANGAIEAAIALRDKGANTEARSADKNHTYLELAVELGYADFCKAMHDYTQRLHSDADQRALNATRQRYETMSELESSRSETQDMEVRLSAEQASSTLTTRRLTHELGYALSRYYHLSLEYQRTYALNQALLANVNPQVVSEAADGDELQAAINQVYDATEEMIRANFHSIDNSDNVTEGLKYQVTFCLFWFGESRPKNIQVTGDFFGNDWNLYGKELYLLSTRSGQNYAVYATTFVLEPGQYQFKYVYRTHDEEMVWFPQDHANLSFIVRNEDMSIIASRDGRQTTPVEVHCAWENGEIIDISRIYEDSRDIMRLGSAPSPSHSFRLCKTSLGCTLWYPNPELKDPERGNLRLTELLSMC